MIITPRSKPLDATPCADISQPTAKTTSLPAGTAKGAHIRWSAHESKWTANIKTRRQNYTLPKKKSPGFCRRFLDTIFSAKWTRRALSRELERGLAFQSILSGRILGGDPTTMEIRWPL